MKTIRVKHDGAELDLYLIRFVDGGAPTVEFRDPATWERVCCPCVNPISFNSAYEGFKHVYSEKRIVMLKDYAEYRDYTALLLAKGFVEDTGCRLRAGHASVIVGLLRMDLVQGVGHVG